MENATKALVMAAEILIGIALVAVAVYFFVTLRQSSKEYEVKMSIQEIVKFNSYFERYIDRKDGNSNKGNISIQEVVSVINYAKEYNKKMEDKMVRVCIDNVLIDYTDYSNSELIKLIEDKTYKVDRVTLQKYECPSHLVDRKTDGRITEIVFKTI